VATSASPAAAHAPATAASGEGGDPVDERQVDVGARILSRAPIPYPPSARQAEIEADVPLELVVGSDGRVVEARVLVRRGYGLDEAALDAVQRYRFSPAVRAGRPVRVRMRWTIQFRLG
jgi:protein TonB